MTQLKQVETQTEAQEVIARIQAATDKFNVLETLKYEFKMMLEDVGARITESQNELEGLRYAEDTSLEIAKLEAEVKFEEIRTNKEIAMETEAVMAQAAYAKAMSYSLKISQQMMRDVFRWDRQNSGAVSWYYGEESDKSVLSDKIKNFFDQAAGSYQQFTDMSEALAAKMES